MDRAVSNKKNAHKLPLTIDAWKLINTNKIEVIQLELKPGISIEKHINSLEIVFYVMKGNGILEVESQLHELSGGDCIPVEANLNRAWHNNSDKMLHLIAIKYLE